ncbi:hypothetical protein K2Q02_01445 [Patescibacteria group bacterium]|nr:hypothetical protein [Patescibacteria group bacterium]
MKEIWFKRKRYGWGWTPSTWQGWTIVGVYLAAFIFLGLSVDETNPREFALGFILPCIILTVSLIRISYNKGESPRWQWGRDTPDTNKEL